MHHASSCLNIMFLYVDQRVLDLGDFSWRTLMPNIPSRSGCTDVRLRSLFYSNSRLLALVLGRRSELVELPKNDPLLGRIPGKASRTGVARTGGWVRYCLISSNACWQASSQMNETPFFINLAKGWHLPERFEINLRMYANRPCNPLSSLRFLGGCISWIARTFSGSK